MDKKTQLKMVVCGVALVSLSAVRTASAQPDPGSACFSGGSISGACVQFNPGPQQWRVDFPGNHSFKVIVNVLQQFYLEIEEDPFTPPEPLSISSRYPPGATLACIPYRFATSDTALGDCVLYNVTAFDSDGNEIPQDEADQYFSGQIIYRIAWDFPTLASAFNNPRGLRAEDELSQFFDLTTGVFPTLQSGEDPGVDMTADGFSQYIVAHQTHESRFAGCLSPLNCSDPDNANLNVFKTGRAVPVKVVLNPTDPGADLRLTYTGPDGTSHLAEAAGNSNDANQFRRSGGSFTFNWKTTGLAPGVYQLTIAPGTNSGHLFAPFTVLVTIQ